MTDTTANAKRRVLIADTDEQVVSAIARELHRRGTFEIHTFASGELAQAAIKSQRFDLVIVAREIPHLDGLTLIREALEQSPHMVSVLLTALNSGEFTSIPENSNAHHYLGKPFQTSELAALIDSIFPTQPVRLQTDPTIVLKVVLGGDANVGKTSLIRRYSTGEFEAARAMTIGVDFHLYDMQIGNVASRLSVWDLGGQERFAFVRRAFYQGARAVGLVYDASNRISFYNLMRWWRETREYLPDVPVLLLANKIDLPRQVDSDEALEIAKAWRVPLFESSCSTGRGVKEFFHALGENAFQYTQTK